MVGESACEGLGTEAYVDRLVFTEATFGPAESPSELRAKRARE